MAFYISGPKLLFETTEISTHPNSTQQESNYIYLYTTKFGTLIKIRLNRKFESTEFETMRVNCILFQCFKFFCECSTTYMTVYLQRLYFSIAVHIFILFSTKTKAKFIFAINFCPSSCHPSICCLLTIHSQIFSSKIEKLFKKKILTIYNTQNLLLIIKNKTSYNSFMVLTVIFFLIDLNLQKK